MEEEKKSGKRHLSVTLNYSCHRYRKSEAGDSYKHQDWPWVAEFS